MTVMVQAQQVGFDYGSHQVLKSIDVTINTGEIIGLIGENGAGKSTLLSLLLGLHRPQRGQLQVCGLQPGDQRAKAQIGVMLQNDVALQGVTVHEVLTLTAAHYATAFDVTTLLAELGLTDLTKRKLTTLSGGQLRRVTFAMALVGNPNLLFLDEPTVGMDTTAQRAFWNRIRALKAAGKTIIITSHHLEEIQNVADRILLLKDGRLTFQGTFQTLQQRFQHVEITFQSPLSSHTFDSLAGVTAVEQHAEELRLISQNGDATLAALTPYFAAMHQITVSRESLADIFVHLTREDV